ncbi:MAG TPA: hypothetical protein VEE85_00170 [Candidatus Bathyarchaeia archaeon]|nr:hypothetical protein [Candidatus Bathyarchaeia archaeon]
MSIIGSTQFLERIQFFNGERLFASDLQSLEAFNREMRWLHNQSLHQAGVGSGFQVVGNTGDRQVTISPGYAIDSCGREIILTENQVLPIPPVADNGSGAPVFYDLTVSYPDDSQLVPAETRVGICTPAGVISLREAPVFCWVQLTDDPTNHQPVDPRLKDKINKALFLVLAQVQIFNCQLKQQVSTVPRRNARPPKQPRVACGTTPYPTSWTATPVGGATSISPYDPATGSTYYPPITISTQVDTSSGQFQATPTYTARLSGNILQNDAKLLGSEGQVTYWIQDGLLSIAQSPAPSPTGFTVNIYPVILTVVSGSTEVESIPIDNTLFQDFQITWMGVES